MTIRSRPVLDRKHRPRWQDELRTQQLTVLGFALAIALALGMFGAAAWNGYWESHLRPVASVAGSTFDRSDLAEREAILTAEAIAEVTELQAQLDGGSRDALLESQINSLSQAFSTVTANAVESLVQGEVLATRAGGYGVSVDEQALDAEVAERLAVCERVRARLLLVEYPGPGDGGSEGDDGDEGPTDDQVAAARADAEAALGRIEGGEEFADVATEVSDDVTAEGGGLIGWFHADDAAYDEYFEALVDAQPGDVVGPLEMERGVALLELLDRREASDSGPMEELLSEQGVSDDEYRAYVRSDLLLEAFRDHFVDEVVGAETPQQRVARIGISPVEGEPVPQERARHVLVQPVPDAESQADATDEQWRAAREEAAEIREQLVGSDADWYAIAEERSDDTASASRGGDLGWYDPASPGFVEEFSDALAQLDVGEVSQPVRSEFGWHVIQKTGERDSPEALAERLSADLDGDLEAFAEAARTLSDDTGTAADGGELGWIAPHQLEPMHEDAVFGLADVGDVSEPVEDEDGTLSIYQLLEASDSREIDEAQRGAIAGSGFDRWLADEVRASVETWVDPQYAAAPES